MIEILAEILLSIEPWVILALTSSAFWAIVQVCDHYSVNDVLSDPWLGVVSSSFAMLAHFPILACGLFVTGMQPVSLGAGLLCVVAGAGFMAGQSFYFRAMAISESGIVSAYWNMLPVMLLVINFTFLGERLTFWQYLGSAVLIASSCAFCVVADSGPRRWQALGMMTVATAFVVLYFLILEIILQDNGTYSCFLIIIVSMTAFGLSPLLLRKRRTVFYANWSQLRSIGLMLFLAESANLLALAASQYAIDLGPASLVAAVEAAIPGFTFLLSLLLYAIFKKYGEENAHHRLAIKMVLVATMIWGVYLVS
jgi:uncharacterized membrane protein